jgi:hypothetical protein
MLGSLIDSQRDTLGFVVAAIYLMLLVLFRNFRLALVVPAPQALPAVTMLGVMGWAGIPLDLVTVMIAAIAIGVGVDSAIQYTMRYREEFARDGDPRARICPHARHRRPRHLDRDQHHRARIRRAGDQRLLSLGLVRPAHRIGHADEPVQRAAHAAVAVSVAGGKVAAFRAARMRRVNSRSAAGRPPRLRSAPDSGSGPPVRGLRQPIDDSGSGCLQRRQQLAPCVPRPRRTAPDARTGGETHAHTPAPRIVHAMGGRWPAGSRCPRGRASVRRTCHHNSRRAARARDQEKRQQPAAADAGSAARKVLPNVSPPPRRRVRRHPGRRRPVPRALFGICLGQGCRRSMAAAGWSLRWGIPPPCPVAEPRGRASMHAEPAAVRP